MAFLSVGTAVVTEHKLDDLENALGLTVADIARGIGASENSVYARRKGSGGQRHTRVDDRVDALYYIVQFLREADRDDELVRGWLLSRSLYLDGRIPLELIGTGNHDELVQAAADAYANGVPLAEWRASRAEDDVTEEGDVIDLDRDRRAG